MRLAAFAILKTTTLLHAEVIRMELLLLPAVAAAATVLQLAAILVCLGVLLCLPILALVFTVQVYVRLSSEVLPVVRVDAYVTLMFLVTKWTPHSLEVKHIEICILLHHFQNVNGEFTFSVGKRTKITVVAAVYTVREGLTKFSLIFFGVVKIFNAIMRTWTIFTKLTVVGIGAKLGSVKGRGSSAVFFI